MSAGLRCAANDKAASTRPAWRTAVRCLSGLSKTSIASKVINQLLIVDGKVHQGESTVEIWK
jgi:hypothetical protein